MAKQLSSLFEEEILTWENIGFISRRVSPHYTGTYLMDILREAYLKNTMVTVVIWRTPVLN